MSQQMKTDDEIIQETVAKLKNIFDPEIPVNIYDLGLIYRIELEMQDRYKHCYVEMTLTSPACPVAGSLVEQVRYVTLSVPEIDEVNVNLVFDPPWDHSLMSEDAQDIMLAQGAVVPDF